MEITTSGTAIKLRAGSKEYNIEKSNIVRVDRSSAYVWILTSDSYAGSKPPKIYSGSVTVPSLGSGTDIQKAINLQNQLQAWINLANETTDVTLVDIANRLGGLDDVAEKYSTKDASINSILKGILSSSNVLTGYVIADIDDAADPKYYGFTALDGSWYIMQETVATDAYRYCKGDSGYETAVTGAWATRALLSYDYFHNIF